MQTITIKTINECDLINYKVPAMFIAMPSCTFKCDKLNKCHYCQNMHLINTPNIEISVEELCKRYINNPLTRAIVFGGLEPFDTSKDVWHFAYTLQHDFHCYDPIVIYTGYTKEELEHGWRDLEDYHNLQEEIIYRSMKTDLKNLIIKYGRYLPNNTPHYDEVLGINLASNNQYAEEYNFERTNN